MSGAFVGLNRLLKFGLASNHIKSITKKAFIGLERLKKLDLSNNNITSVQENAFSSMSELKELLINTTSLLCDCKLKWFPAWLEATNFQAPIIAVCAYPEWLEGKFVMQVQLGNFTCGKYSWLFSLFLFYFLFYKKYTKKSCFVLKCSQRHLFYSCKFYIWKVSKFEELKYSLKTK
jgi:hypothetical protein